MVIPSLHLSHPRLQPNTLPCSAEEADLCALLSCNDISCIRQLRVNLPSVTDLASLLKDDAGAFEIGGNMGHRIIMMEVEILGCTQGATFSIGTAKIDLPTAETSPDFSEELSRSCPFREPLLDGTGRKAGMLSGHFSVQLGRQKCTNNVGHVHLDEGDTPTCPQKASYVRRNRIENRYIKCYNPGDDPETLNASRCKAFSKLMNFEDAQGEAAANLLDIVLSMLISSNFNPTGGRRIEQHSKAQCETYTSGRGQLVGQDQDRDRGTSPRTSGEKVAKSESEKCEEESMHRDHHQLQHDDHPHLITGRRAVASSERTVEDCSQSRPEMIMQQAGAKNHPCTTPTSASKTVMRARARATSGFRFKATERRVDWFRLATTDVSKIERDGDLKSLGRFLHDVTGGKVDGYGIEADPTLVKAFRLAQLQTQYVLHCHQKALSTHEAQVLRRQSKSLRAAITSMESEAQDICRQFKAVQDQLRTFRTESNSQNKVIRNYSGMLERHSLSSAAQVRPCDTRNLTISEEDEVKGAGGERQGARERQRQKLPRHRRESHLAAELGYGLALNQDAQSDHQVNSTSSRSCSSGEEQEVRLARHVDDGGGDVPRILPDHNRRERVFSVNRIPKIFKDPGVAAQVPHEVKGTFLKDDTTLVHCQDETNVIIGHQPPRKKTAQGEHASFTGDANATERVRGGIAEGRDETSTDRALGRGLDERNSRLRYLTTMKPHDRPTFPSSPKCHQERGGVSSSTGSSESVSSAVYGQAAGGDVGGNGDAEAALTFEMGGHLGQSNEVKLEKCEGEAPPGVYSGEHKTISLEGTAGSLEQEMGDERVERRSNSNNQTRTTVKAPPCKRNMGPEVVAITVTPIVPVDSQPSPTNPPPLGESVGHESRPQLPSRRAVCGAAVVERGDDMALTDAYGAAASCHEGVCDDPVASTLIRVDQMRHHEPKKGGSNHPMVASAQQEADTMRDQVPLSIERIRQAKREGSSSMSSIHLSAPDPERLGLDPETVLDFSDLEVEGESEIDIVGGGESDNNGDSSVGSS